MTPGRKPKSEVIRIAFATRMSETRAVLGSRGSKTSRVKFAEELDIDQNRYREWEDNGADPGFDDLRDALARLDSVKVYRVDPGALARWIQTGEGESPLRGIGIAAMTGSTGSTPATGTPGVEAEALDALSRIADLYARASKLNVLVDWDTVIKLAEFARGFANQGRVIEEENTRSTIMSMLNLKARIFVAERHPHAREALDRKAVKDIEKQVDKP